MGSVADAEASEWATENRGRVSDIIERRSTEFEILVPAGVLLTLINNWWMHP